MKAKVMGNIGNEGGDIRRFFFFWFSYFITSQAQHMKRLIFVKMLYGNEPFELFSLSTREKVNHVVVCICCFGLGPEMKWVWTWPSLDGRGSNGLLRSREIRSVKINLVLFIDISCLDFLAYHLQFFFFSSFFFFFNIITSTSVVVDLLSLKVITV